EAEPIGRRAVGIVPLLMFAAFVASVEQLGAAFERSPHAGCTTVIAAPVPACLRKREVPPVAARSAPVPPRATPSNPLLILAAFVVSVVALAAKAEPLVFKQVIASVPAVVQSPEMSPLVMDVAPENFV